MSAASHGFAAWLNALSDDRRKTIQDVLNLGARVRKLTPACNKIRADRLAQLYQQQSIQQKEFHEKIEQELRNLRGAQATTSELPTKLLSLRDTVMRHEEWTALAMAERSKEELNEGVFAERRTALAEFQTRLEELRDDWEKKNSNEKFPWQVSYSSEADPFDKGAAVEFSGGKITDKDGRDVWADVCVCCSWAIQEGLSHGVGAPRMRCLDCAFAVVCTTCANVQKLLATLPSSAVLEVFPEVKFRHASHLWLTETNHPVFLRHNTWDSHTLPTLLYRASINYAHRPLFGTRMNDHYTWMTFAEVWSAAHRLARALAALLPPNSFVAIGGKNSANWYITDLACTLCSFTSVGLAPSLDARDLHAVLRKSRCVALLCSNNEVVKFVDAERTDRVSSLHFILSIDAVSSSPSPPVADLEILLGIEALEQRAAANKSYGEPTISEKPSEEELTTLDKNCTQRHDRMHMLIFTSGSTGTPKGAVITEKNWMKDVNNPDWSSPLVICSWMPAAHGADRSSVWRVMLNGGRIGFASASLPLDDLSILRPSFFFAPPALWTTLKHEYHVDIANGIPEDEAKLRMRKMLGDRCQWLGTGAAAVPRGLIEWMQQVFDLRVAEAYGATEVGGISCDGKKSPETEIKILDVPDMGYFASDKPYPRGELLARSPIIIPRYFEEDEESKKGFEDGWFHTGDIVELRSPTEIVVIDRKTSIFKTANGEFISLSKTEGVYQSSPHVRQLCLVGDAGCSALVAIIVPSKSLLSRSDTELEIQLFDHLRQIAVENHLRACEFPGSVIIDREEWTPHNGLLSALYKLARRSIQARHAATLARRFAQLTQSPPAAPLLTGNNSNSAEPADRVIEIASQLLSRPIDSSLSFIANGGDSLAGTSFLLRLRSTFPGTSWALDFVLHAPLVQLAAQHQQQGGVNHAHHSWKSQNDASLLAQISTDIQPPPVPLTRLERKSAALRRSLCLLLTGATGFLGSHLLFSLLSQPSNTISTVYCIVRGTSDEDAASRLSDALTKFRIQLDSSSARLRVVAGDCSKPQLGLTAQTYLLLQSSLDGVIHCAAQVSFGASYDSLRAANVTAVSNIFTLCASTNPPLYLHHISSLSVFGSESESIAPTERSPLPSSPAQLLAQCTDGYAQSKCAAELLLNRCVSTLDSTICPPISIHRCGFISWHTASGASHPSDWLTLLLLGVKQTKSFPSNPCALSLAPVDFVAAAIVSLVSQQSMTTPPRIQVFHLCNTQLVPFSLLSSAWLVGATKLNIHSTSMKEFQSALLNSSSSSSGSHSRKDLLRLLPLLDGGLPRSVAPSDLFTRPLLDAASISCPAVTQESFKRHVDYLCMLEKEQGK